jgi:hypothetical protein
MILDWGMNEKFSKQKMSDWTFVGSASMTWVLSDKADPKKKWGSAQSNEEQEWYSKFIDSEGNVGLVDNALMFALAMPILGLSLLFGCCF